MQIFIIRHGESETNLYKKLTGWYDTPLTNKGVEEALRARLYLQQFNFDKVFTSDLIRAFKTAQTALPNYTPEACELLREINVGNLANTYHSEISKEIKLRTAQVGYHEFGGESREDFKKRIQKFMKFAEALNYQNIAVFSHAGWMRAMLDIVIGSYLPRNLISCDNCAIAIYQCDNHSWKLNSWINLNALPYSTSK